ncbi:hypothetical protein [Microbispora corallina]|uniref:hypothetical protein n=1 Tax=Microbispora corallina TaxID=83302 RepID=UPI0019523F1C
MKDAFVAHATGGTLPSRLAHLDSGTGEFHIKASGADDAVAVKIGACFYDRPATLGLESIVGVITLFDGRTGQPLLLMESAAVPRIRPAATTAAAVRHLPGAGGPEPLTTGARAVCSSSWVANDL